MKRGRDRRPPSRVAATCEDAVRPRGRCSTQWHSRRWGPRCCTRPNDAQLRCTSRTRRTSALRTTTSRDRFGPDMTAALVQRMVPARRRDAGGAVQDPLFGPLIACGTGGTLVDLLDDTVFQAASATVPDAAAMLDEVRGARLLRGFRGAAPADEPALRDILLRVSRLLTLAPEIQELDLNPVIVLGSGAWAADVRVRNRPKGATSVSSTCRVLIHQ